MAVASGVVRPKVYVETSVVSYLTARPSRDVVRMGRQLVTRQWWDVRHRFELFVSQLVLAEAAAGDPSAAAARLAALDGVTVLESVRAAGLADDLAGSGAVPGKAYADALHVAVAAVNGIDHLVTWNCSHIANAILLPRIQEGCRLAGFEPPTLCTPDQLLGDRSPELD